MPSLELMLMLHQGLSIIRLYYKAERSGVVTRLWVHQTALYFKNKLFYVSQLRSIGHERRSSELKTWQ